MTRPTSNTHPWKLEKDEEESFKKWGFCIIKHAWRGNMQVTPYAISSPISLQCADETVVYGKIVAIQKPSTRTCLYILNKCE